MALLRQGLRLCLIVSVVMANFALATERPIKQDDSAVALPEVRLRKLHLVRPDLIPYPLFYEVLC